VKLFVDTSVWSLAFRRDRPPHLSEVHALFHALDAGEIVVTTGIVLQELLQGFRGPGEKDLIISRFTALPLLTPDLTEHVNAAELRNLCRRKGVQVGTIDALLAQLCIRHDLTLLTTDKDFERVAVHSDLRIWER
jgi:predicted nucleic acid-binding protein